MNELLMHNYNTLPPNCKKFWAKRYKLFKKYDEGVFMTAEQWYSVTPENVARFTALLIKALIPETKRVADLCCGAGGNTIQLAKVFPEVLAVDINETNVECVKHNCAVYGVNAAVVHADWLEYSKECERVDFAYASPPWGGTNYKSNPKFDLHAMKPINLRDICTSAKRVCDNFILFLPRQSMLEQLSEVALELYGEKLVRHLYVSQDGHTVGLLAIFGPCTKETLRILSCTEVEVFDDDTFNML